MTKARVVRRRALFLAAGLLLALGCEAVAPLRPLSSPDSGSDAAIADTVGEAGDALDLGMESEADRAEAGSTADVPPDTADGGTPDDVPNADAGDGGASDAASDDGGVVDVAQ